MLPTVGACRGLLRRDPFIRKAPSHSFHARPTGACNCPATTADTLDSCHKGNYNGGHLGVGGWGNGFGCLHSSQKNDGNSNWYMSLTGTCGNYCNSRKNECNVEVVSTTRAPTLAHSSTAAQILVK